MSVSKLNRMIRLSEATKDVCARVDDGSLHLSTASAISFLKPESQDEVLHLVDLGYKVKNEQVERMKKVDKAGKLDEMTMRDILDDKDIKPKLPPTPPAPVPHQPVSPPTHRLSPTPPPHRPQLRLPRQKKNLSRGARSGPRSPRLF